MRKRIVDAAHADAGSQSFVGWRHLEQIATIEVTSEDPGFPIESVFISDEGPGWRAAHGGRQQIRIIFDEPVSVRRIQLRFDEAEAERTQEFTLRCSSADGHSREIIRQCWNFSPLGSTMESEDYAVDFAHASVLELTIEPDVSRGGCDCDAVRVTCSMMPTTPHKKTSRVRREPCRNHIVIARVIALRLRKNYSCET